MKKPVVIIGVVAAIGLIAGAVWLFTFSRSAQNNTISNPSASLPAVSSTFQGKTQSATSAPIQQISSPENPEVAKDFLSEAQNVNQITLGGTVVALPYALQIWGNTNSGGEALLEYASSTGWTLVSLGGGEWSVLALIQEGVPQLIAEQLVAGLTNSASAPSPVVSPMNIPAGNTIAIGTSQGSVTTNNFYKSADYIAQDQQMVVIRQSSTYIIVYNVSNSSFTVTIQSVPLEAVRQTAEAAFLNSLGISQQDACKLNVYESVLANVSDKYVGKSLPLSFCGNPTAL
jgi:hypothetical protein